MRGVAFLIVMLFVMGGVMVFAGPTIEPLYDTVTSYQAVQDAGHVDPLTRTRNIILRWVPLTAIMVGLVWAVGWYLRRERTTGRGPRR